MQLDAIVYYGRFFDIGITSMIRCIMLCEYIIQIQSNNYRAVHVQGSSNSGNYSVVFKKITNLKPKFSPSTAPTVYLPPSITQYFNPQVLSYTGINYFKPKPLVAKVLHSCSLCLHTCKLLSIFLKGSA